MLDLKSKLLAAGLVTQDQVNKVDEEKHPRHKKKGLARPRLNTKADTSSHVNGDDFEKRQRKKALDELKSLPKSEQYDMIRRWVLRNQLDKQNSLPSENAQKYFFQKADNSISWLTLEPSVHAQVIEGTAGIMAYMSNHGLTHCVVPRDIVEDVAEVFPQWLRVLKDHPLSQDAKTEDVDN